MHENRFKRCVRAGAPAVAMWMHTPSLKTLHVAARHHVDAVFLDMEHAPTSLRDVQDMSRLARALGLTILVRPPALESEHAGRLLDCGAEGIIFPQVGDGPSAADARRRVMYPPDGTRGWGGDAPAGFSGSLADRGAFAAHANAQVTSIFLIESPSAADRIDEILEAGHPDGVMFGWSDFAAAVAFDVDRSVMAAQRVHDACRERGIGVGLYPGPHHGLSGAAAHYPWYPGCFMVAGADDDWLAKGLVHGVEAARAAARSDLASEMSHGR